MSYIYIYIHKASNEAYHEVCQISEFDVTIYKSFGE